MAIQAHRVAPDLVARVAVAPAERVRIAAHAADLVAIDADRGRALVMAGGAAGDVAARLEGVRVGPRERPARRVRITRARRVGRQVLRAVAVAAEVIAMAALAELRLRPRV